MEIKIKSKIKIKLSTIIEGILESTKLYFWPKKGVFILLTKDSKRIKTGMGYLTVST